MDADEVEVLADHAHHVFDREFADGVYPFGLGLALPFVAIALDERLTDFFQVFSGVKAFGHGADILAQRFAVAQMRGARQNVHLRARVVEVIFLGDGIARLAQKPRQRVADNRAAHVARVHGACGIGGDVFDVDLLALAHLAVAVFDAVGKDGAKRIGPFAVGQAEVDEARPRDGNFLHTRHGFHFFGKRLAKLARVLARRFGKHHGGVRRHVAVRGVLGRFHLHARKVEPFGQVAVGGHAAQHVGHFRLEGVENIAHLIT